MPIIREHRQTEQALQGSLKEKEVLLKEIHHRVKNNLQIIYSLLRLQQRSLKDTQAAASLLDSQNQIESIALIHEKLYRTDNLAQIDFSDYIPSLIRSLWSSYGIGHQKVTVKTKVGHICLDIDKAIPCGLIINELISNALKYAFPAEAIGQLQVELDADEDFNIKLLVSDNGIGLPEKFDLAQTNSLVLCGVSSATIPRVSDVRCQVLRTVARFTPSSTRASVSPGFCRPIKGNNSNR